MANALTAFNPTLWSRRGIAILREKLVMANLVYKDFSQELASYGDTVNTRKPAKFTANTKGATTNVTVQDATATNVAVVLNQHKEVTFRIFDIEASKSFADLVRTYLDPAMLAIANSIDTALMGLYTDISTSVTPASGATWDNNMVDIRTTLNNQLVPMDSRQFVVSNDVEGSLLKTNGLVRFDALGEQGGAIRTGAIGRLSGFDIYRGDNVVSVGSPAVVKNLAFHSNAFALVSRPLATAVQPAPGVVQRVVADNDTGIAMRTTFSYDADAMATQVTVDVLFGVKTLDANLACRVDT